MTSKAVRIVDIRSHGTPPRKGTPRQWGWHDVTILAGGQGKVGRGSGGLRSWTDDLSTAPDTVPFALWCAARHIDDYAEAIWTTVSAGGDNDTNCAIVGGIVVLAGGPNLTRRSGPNAS